MIIHQTINSLGNYNYNAYIYTDITWDSHFHGDYELIYAIKGTPTIKINGEKIVLQEKHLILIPQYSIHYIEIDKNTSVWIGVFSENFIRDFSVKYKYYKFSDFTCEQSVLSFLSKHIFYQGTPDIYIY